MKKRLLVIGLLLSLLANTLAVVVFATNGEEIVQAILNKNIKLTWNGAEFQPVDPVTNERIYPIIYNNRTYIPARFIAEKSGVVVNWNENTQTVSFDAGYNALDGKPWKDSQNYGSVPVATPTPKPSTPAPVVTPQPSASSQGVTFGMNLNVRKLIEGRSKIRISDTTLDALNPDGTFKLNGVTIGGETAYTTGFVDFEITGDRYSSDYYPPEDRRILSDFFQEIVDMLKSQGYERKYNPYDSDITYWTKGDCQYILTDGTDGLLGYISLDFCTGWYKTDL